MNFGAGWTREGGMTPQQQNRFLSQWSARQEQAKEDERREREEEDRRRQQSQPATQQLPQQLPQQNQHFAPNHAAPMHNYVAREQASALQGMIDKTSDAWDDELDSRVAQAREMRRMQHAKEIEAMRQEGLLQRLAMMAQGMRPSGPTSYEPDQGGALRIWNPVTQQYDRTNEVITRVG